MATFTIDDKEIEIVPGKNLLQTAVENDVYIPHYCYHPGLSAPANCRMCLVEIEAGGRRGMAPSCTAMPAEGMVVGTQSEEVKRNQNAVMEFLLINHPLDCPVCDQSGECELQNYSYTYGPDRSRFLDQKTIQPKKDIGEHTLLYSDRCIRCTRCIRFCDEVSGTSELGYFNRGVHNEIDIFPGERLDNRLSGNTVDICPVGALLDKDFLFKQRVWFLKEVDTLCTGCSAGCNIRADYNNERIYRLVPRENMDVNEYWMCDDGRHGWGYVHSDDRLLFPMIGRGADPDLVLWEAALEKVRDGFEKIREAHGPASIAGFASSHLTNEENFLFGILFKDLLEGASIGIRPKVSQEGDTTFKGGFTIRADKSPNSRGVTEILSGLGVSITDPVEIWRGIQEGNIKALYILGGDPLERITEAERSSLGKLEFLVVQDILANDLSRQADVILPGATFIEKNGTFTNCDGRVQKINQGLEPVGDARADWRILKDVIEMMGGSAPYDEVEDVMADLANAVEAFAQLESSSVGSLGALLSTIEKVEA